MPAITEKAFVAAREQDGGYASYSIIDEGWKLIHNIDPTPGVPELELYDHVKDPLNLTNVAAEHPDKVKELAEQLERWRQMAESQRLESDADMAAQASPEELERLRALGYL